MTTSKRINRLVADKPASAIEKLGDDRDRAQAAQSRETDSVAKVYGCLGYTIDTDAIMRSLRGQPD